MVVHSTDIKCQCIRDCENFSLYTGTTYKGRVEFEKSGKASFIIYHPNGGPIKCIQDWFVEFFELLSY